MAAPREPVSYVACSEEPIEADDSARSGGTSLADGLVSETGQLARRNRDLARGHLSGLVLVERVTRLPEEAATTARVDAVAAESTSRSSVSPEV